MKHRKRSLSVASPLPIKALGVPWQTGRQSAFRMGFARKCVRCGLPARGRPPKHPLDDYVCKDRYRCKANAGPVRCTQRTRSVPAGVQRRGFIYALIHTKSVPPRGRYVGKTLQRIEARLSHHMSDASACRLIKKALQKCSKDAFRYRQAETLAGSTS